MQAIKQLHPDIISNTQSKTLFSKQEENLLGTVLSVSVLVHDKPQREGVVQIG